MAFVAYLGVYIRSAEATVGWEITQQYKTNILPRGSSSIRYFTVVKADDKLQPAYNYPPSLKERGLSSLIKT